MAGNWLVKFALITDSHLLDIGCKLTPSEKGVKEIKSPKRPIKYYFLIAFSDKGHISWLMFKKSQWIQSS